MTRKLYITDKMLARKRACLGARNQLDEVLGTRARKVPVTINTVLAVERLLYRLSWAVDWLLTPKQRKVYDRERAVHPITSTGPVSQFCETQWRDAQAFVDAYYSPKK